MKTILLIVSIAVASSAFAAGSKFNSGYIRKDGTYVQPHFKSAPNSTKFDNYSTRGNANPYTGKQGTVDPYAMPAPRYDTPTQPAKRAW